MLPVISDVEGLRRYESVVRELYSLINATPSNIDWGVVDEINKALARFKAERRSVIKGDRRVINVGNVEVIIADTISLINNYMSMYRTYAENAVRMSRVVMDMVDGNPSLIYLNPFTGSATIVMNTPIKPRLTDAETLGNTINALRNLNTVPEQASKPSAESIQLNVDVTKLLDALVGKSGSVYVDVGDEAYRVIRNYIHGAT